MTQIQVVVPALDDEIVGIIGGITDRIAVFDGLQDGYIIDVPESLDHVFRLGIHDALQARALIITEPKIELDCFARILQVLLVVFCSHAVSTAGNDRGQLLDARFIPLFQALDLCYAVFQLFSDLFRNLRFAFIAVTLIDLIVVHYGAVIRRIGQILRRRKSVDLFDQLFGCRFHHIDGQLEMNLDCGIGAAEHRQLKLVFLPIKGKRRISPDFSCIIQRILFCHEHAVGIKARCRISPEILIKRSDRSRRLEGSHVGGYIHDIIPAISLIPDFTGGIAILVRLEQRSLRLAMINILGVKARGAVKIAVERPVSCTVELHIRRFGHNELINFFHVSIFQHKNVLVLADGPEIIFSRDFPIHKITDLVTILRKEFDRGSLRQTGNRCGEANIVVLRQLRVFTHRSRGNDAFLGIIFHRRVVAFTRSVFLKGPDRDRVRIQQRADRLDCHGVDLRFTAVRRRGLPTGVTALNREHAPVDNRDFCLGSNRILGVAHIHVDLELPVRRSREDGDLGHALLDQCHIFVNIRRERRHQLALLRRDRNSGKRLVAALPVRANIFAQTGAGVFHRDLIAKLQRPVSNGILRKALVGEPAVQCTHPARVRTVSKFGHTTDAADIAFLRAHNFVARAIQGFRDAGHHSGIFSQINI